MTGTQKPLYQIKAPHFCAAFEPGGRFAPIIAYMKSWSFVDIVHYCNKKGWTVKAVETAE